MSARTLSAVSGSLLMWVLAGAWWLESDRSALAAVGALAVGALGTAVAAWGARKPVPSRRRALVAAAIGALAAIGLAVLVRL